MTMTRLLLPPQEVHPDQDPQDNHLTSTTEAQIALTQSIQQDMENQIEHLHELTQTEHQVGQIDHLAQEAKMKIIWPLRVIRKKPKTKTQNLKGSTYYRRRGNKTIRSYSVKQIYLSGCPC